MSQENVEFVQDGFSALGRGDFESFLAMLGQEVEWVNPAYAIEPGTRRGIDGFRDALDQLRASFGDVRPEVLEMIDAGDGVVVVGRWRGEGTGSGLPIEATFSSVVTVQDSQIVRYEWFRKKAEALEAVGLPE